MKRLKYGLVLLVLFLLFMVTYQQQSKNVPSGAAALCLGCPGNMRSSEDGKSCVPMCDKSAEPACPDVSIKCPTLVAGEAPKLCATCPSGWHPAGEDKCISEDRKTFISCPQAVTTVTTTTTTTLANPASVNCVQNLGGTLEIRKDREGNEYGVCHLPDGRGCEEWALFRGEKCPTCLNYCESQPHIECVGTWKISGTYPACTCEYSCSIR